MVLSQAVRRHLPAVPLLCCCPHTGARRPIRRRRSRPRRARNCSQRPHADNRVVALWHLELWDVNSAAQRQSVRPEPLAESASPESVFLRAVSS